ncbi:MAG TPA: hypothetical protein VEY71_04255 [Chitinophagales bacterium]|nr:hypothetical protein [Chitinophagales bacterium]
MKKTELVRDAKTVWLVEENSFSFVKDQSEWVGAKIVFDIPRKKHKTLLRFTHQGLTSAYACYDICERADSGTSNKVCST